jgi:3-hydroxy-9,10-secoandrosta-1,3,5(10)-triene-9,17-dione monooxygenase
VEAKTNINTQKLIAEVITDIDEMWNSIDHNFGSMMNAVSNKEKLEIQDRIKYRYHASAIVDRCVAGAAKLVKASGGASVYLGHEVMAKYLDIMTIQVHVANISEPFAVNYGGTLLGLDNTDINI